MNRKIKTRFIMIQTDFLLLNLKKRFRNFIKIKLFCRLFKIVPIIKKHKYSDCIVYLSMISKIN